MDKQSTALVGDMREKMAILTTEVSMLSKLIEETKASIRETKLSIDEILKITRGIDGRVANLEYKTKLTEDRLVETRLQTDKKITNLQENVADHQAKFDNLEIGYRYVKWTLTILATLITVLGASQVANIIELLKKVL